MYQDGDESFDALANGLLGQAGGLFRELLWIETRSMPQSGVPDRRVHPFLPFACETIDQRFDELRAGRYHTSELCSLPRVLTIAVERSGGQDRVVLPGSFVAPRRDGDDAISDLPARRLRVVAPGRAALHVSGY